ncbi:copper-binding protein [Nitratireductor luteus]|uniref:copper-binding protein n=1 Tax=Nitratireductor luteus TaxID=2976980 RepID=UPI00223ECAF6|nr:copper-binding protein [Nitratireductor luteus]
MKLIAKLIVALALSGTLAGTALAAEYTKGEIKKIDTAQKKLTIKHEELKNLDMPAMTMVFVVADDAMLDKVKVGQPVEFVAERVNGRLTVTEIQQ